MLRSASAAFLALALVPAAHAAVDCSVNTSASPLPLPATTIAPVADELYIRGNQLGMPAGVLSSNNSAATFGVAYDYFKIEPSTAPPQQPAPEPAKIYLPFARR